jgi:uncharacterized protein (DUF58 family)
LLFSRSMVVLALSLAILLIGVNSQSAWLFWMVGLLLSSLLVSWALSLYEVRNMSLVRLHDAEVSEEESLQITLKIRNRGRFSRHLLEIIDEDPCAKTPRKRPRLRPKRMNLRDRLVGSSPSNETSPDLSGQGAAFLVPSLEPGGEAAISYQRGGLRRGSYSNWPGFFYSEGIIGLARHTGKTRPESSLVVFPSFKELSSFPLVDTFLHPQETSHDLSPKGPGTDYFGVREFRPGDQLRHVHWRTTARRGELVVKEFERESGTPLTILLDNRDCPESANNGSAVLDCEARLAASVAHYAYYAGHPVSLAAYQGDHLNLYDVPAFRGALQWLASLLPEGSASCEQQLEGLRPEISPGSFVCCIFPAMDIDFSRLASSLPPLCHMAIVLVQTHSMNGEGRAGHSAAFAEELANSLIGSPFEGLFSVSLYREGDDLQECLEKPLIIFGNSQLQKG